MDRLINFTTGRKLRGLYAVTIDGPLCGFPSCSPRQRFSVTVYPNCGSYSYDVRRLHELFPGPVAAAAVSHSVRIYLPHSAALCLLGFLAQSHFCAPAAAVLPLVSGAPK